MAAPGTPFTPRPDLISGPYRLLWAQGPRYHQALRTRVQGKEINSHYISADKKPDFHRAGAPAMRR